MKQSRALVKAAARRYAVAARALTTTLVCFKRGSYPGAGRGVGLFALGRRVRLSERRPYRA